MKGKYLLKWLPVAALFGIVAAGIWILVGSERREKPAVTTPVFENLSAAPPTTTNVHLYFGDRNGAYLTAESRSVHAAKNPTAMGKSVMAALLDGPNDNLTRLLPEGTALRALFVPPGGVAYVDIEPAAEAYPGGARSELLTVYSIVNSLVLNVPQIERVKLLVAGRESNTLAGHVALNEPLAAQMLLVR